MEMLLVLEIKTVKGLTYITSEVCMMKNCVMKIQ